MEPLGEFQYVSRGSFSSDSICAMTFCVRSNNIGGAFTAGLGGARASGGGKGWGFRLHLGSGLQSLLQTLHPDFGSELWRPPRHPSSPALSPGARERGAW